MPSRPLVNQEAAMPHLRSLAALLMLCNLAQARPTLAQPALAQPTLAQPTLAQPDLVQPAAPPAAVPAAGAGGSLAQRAAERFP